MMFDRLPSRDDPAWADAPLSDLLRPLTSDYIGARTVPAEGEQTEAPKPKRLRNITTAQRARVVELIGRGLRYRDIADQVGIGGSTVEDIAAQHRNGAGMKVCVFPGCENVLYHGNLSAVCRTHNHADGYCQCVKCRATG